MSPVCLIASKWMEQHRRGAATIVGGQRPINAHEETTAARAGPEAEAKEPGTRTALIEGRLDADDLARVLTGFRGQPIAVTRTMRYVRTSADGEASAYVFDEETGMVYILD
jgi:hypothetical protein